MACCVIKKTSHLSWSEKGFSSIVASTSIFCIVYYHFIICVHQYPLFCILCYHFIICVYQFLFVFQNSVHFTTIPPISINAEHCKFTTRRLDSKRRVVNLQCSALIEMGVVVVKWSEFCYLSNVHHSCIKRTRYR